MRERERDLLTKEEQITPWLRHSTLLWETEDQIHTVNEYFFFIPSVVSLTAEADSLFLYYNIQKSGSGKQSGLLTESKQTWNWIYTSFLGHVKDLFLFLWKILDSTWYGKGNIWKSWKLLWSRILFCTQPLLLSAQELEDIAQKYIWRSLQEPIQRTCYS